MLISLSECSYRRLWDWEGKITVHSLQKTRLHHSWDYLCHSLPTSWALLRPLEHLVLGHLERSVYARPLETLWTQWTIQQSAKCCQRSDSVAGLTFLITHHPLHSQALTNYTPLKTSDRAVSEYSAFLSGRDGSHIHTNSQSRQELVPTSETLTKLSSASTMAAATLT